MFCGECGTKNKKDSLFCEECGHKLVEEKETKKTTKKEVSKNNTKKEVKNTPKKEEVKKETVKKEPMSKKNKIIIGVLAAVVVIMVSAYMYIGSTLKPEKIATKYFKAYFNKDADRIASIIKFDNSEFVSKKLLKEGLKDSKKIEISNYSTEKIVGRDGLTTSVKFKYYIKGSSTPRFKTIKLTKEKNKKYLFFDNWTVDSSELISKDYTLNVPVDSEVEIDGVKLAKKYKKESTSSYYDTYKIPSILKGNYKITAKLKSGILLEGTLNVNGDYASFSSNNLKIEKEAEKKILKEIENKITLIYDSVVSDKSFDDIKDNFEEDYRDDIENTYNILKENALTDYNKLKEFKLTEAKIKYYSISEDELNLTVQIKYNYKVEYENGDDTKEYSKTGKTSTVYVTYKLDKKKYALSNIRSLVSYFSHYSY